MNTNKLTGIARIVLVICGLALLIVLFVPLWQIELAAPQYPEGLVLKMFPNKLAGNVDIINGLNHYIGMKTLHTKDFFEFTILPYLIGFFAVACFICAFINKQKWLVVLCTAFVLFGIVAMADFYRWNYNYGHNLDPNAAISIPGMSYQPPLIGYKKLLNFGAYSVPDIGGWIFIGVGILLLTAVVIEFKMNKQSLTSRLKNAVTALFVIGMMTIVSCSTGPKPITLGSDGCAYCKMSIMDSRFGAEMITKKGKVFKFDDIHCLLQFKEENRIDKSELKQIYLVDFDEPHNFIEVSKSLLLKGEGLHSPMAGNIASFADQKHLEVANQKFGGQAISWTELVKE